MSELVATAVALKNWVCARLGSDKQPCREMKVVILPVYVLLVNIVIEAIKTLLNEPVRHVFTCGCKRLQPSLLSLASY